MSREDLIYLDHAAATPVCQPALDAMLPYFQRDFFNPSAPYLPAKHVRVAYEQAKDSLAHVIGAKGADLVITSGATESINLAFTILKPYPAAKALVLATEHTAVLATAEQYFHQSIAVQPSGLIDLRDFQQKLTDDVVLVSVSLANNELGTIQPLAEIAELLRKARQDRLARGVQTPLYLHSDASQALSLMDINVARLGVDLLTLNAAKCGGPKGIGALYVGHGIRLCPLAVGGGQERGLRAGTENVPGLIGFAAAAEYAKAHLTSHRKKYQEMAQFLKQELAHISIVAQKTEKVKHKLDPASLKHDSDSELPNLNLELPEPIFLGSEKHQLANFVPVCFPGIDAERLVYRLEQDGVLVATGAACAASKGSKSHVLAAIGLSDAEIAGSLRISLGSTNDMTQIKHATEIIKDAVRHEYSRIGFGDVGRERLKERSADREEQAPREDGRASGSRETNVAKAKTMSCSVDHNDATACPEKNNVAGENRECIHD